MNKGRQFVCLFMVSCGPGMDVQEGIHKGLTLSFDLLELRKISNTSNQPDQSDRLSVPREKLIFI